MTDATLYLRLSDFRDDSDGFTGREARLRTEAKRLGWTVGRVVVENDVIPNANGNGRSRPASAFKRGRPRQGGHPVRDKDTGRVLKGCTGPACSPSLPTLRPGAQTRCWPKTSTVPAVTPATLKT